MIARYSDWLRQMEEKLTAFADLDIGYPKGDNRVLAPPSCSAGLDSGLSDENRESLRAFYSLCDGLSLPDVGEGIFIDGCACLGREKGVYTPTKVAERGWPILVLGSFGDGSLIVMRKDTGEILRLPPSKIEDNVYSENMRTPIQVLASDLKSFLDWVLMAVPQPENGQGPEHTSLRIRRRRSDDEDIDALNLRVLGELRQTEPLWQPGKLERDVEIEHHVAGATVELWQGLRNGLGGAIEYKSRTSLPNTDQAMNDDKLTIGPRLDRIPLAEFDYAGFCRTIAPRAIEAFGAYRAALITDHERSVTDWDIVRHEMIEHNRSIEGRDGVIRIWPVSYFDDTLCQRAWGLSGEEVVRRAAPACEEAYPLAGGAFLLVTPNWCAATPWTISAKA